MSSQAEGVNSTPAPHPAVARQSLPSQFPGSAVAPVPFFPAGRSHLPTPQSPDYMGHYLNFQSPESPLAHGQTSYISFASMGRPMYGMPVQKIMPPGAAGRPAQQVMTPESSPFASRYDSHLSTPLAIPHFNSYAFHVPQSSSSSINSFRPTTPPPSNLNLASLSSPFVAKTPQGTASSSRPMQSLQEDALSQSMPVPVPGHPDEASMSIPISPAVSPPNAPVSDLPGGEMERLRQTMAQNQMKRYQDTEARRPEYLKRGKRPISETDLAQADEDGHRRSNVGVVDSPHKGRRLALFQETSDESFEESLMAGGYGRYRTADWIRQPQPAQTPAPPPPVPAPARSEVPPPPPEPLSDKEIRKRKRLAAFRPNQLTNTAIEPSRLFPVIIEGMGRVLLDTATEEQRAQGADAAKRGTVLPAKKIKKRTEPSARERRAIMNAAQLEEMSDKPNWLDTDFPWRLRIEERRSIDTEESEQRLDAIKKFLDRDTDAEDSSSDDEPSNEELLPPSAWTRIYEPGADRPTPSRGGRGKMVPLAADPLVSDPRTVGNRRGLLSANGRRFFPTDPGDAVQAFHAKKTIRAFTLKLRRRKQREEQDEDDDDVACICHGKRKDDNVVQCDQCEIWYHLYCLNIPNIAALGPEEDAWYCQKCQIVEQSDDSDDAQAVEGMGMAEDLVEDEPSPEPIFAPTDSEPVRNHSNDAPLFQVLDSPSRCAETSRHELKTPPRPSTRRWNNGFTTPTAHPEHPLDEVQESFFDPLSTPSRGMRLAGGFVTPKAGSSGWSIRAHETPSKRRDSSSWLFGASGTLDESAGLFGSSPLMRMSFDDSPIRRNTAAAHRILDGLEDSSPITKHVGRNLFEELAAQSESPIYNH